MRAVQGVDREREAVAMWFGGGDEDLVEHERDQIEAARAAITRIRNLQRLRAEVRRTDTAHQRALQALADAALEHVVATA